MFIADEYKNGKRIRDKGSAILHVSLFLDWMRKNVKSK
jgi:hypothetical protein